MVGEEQQQKTAEQQNPHDENVKEPNGDGESPHEERRIPLKAFLSALNGRQWLTFGILYLANLCAAMTFSCIVPFFPAEARMRQLTFTQIGIIIGAFQITMFLASPLLGKFIAQIGPNRMFTGGLILSSFGTMLYSLLPLFPSSSAFFIAAMGFRCASALGNAAFRTSSLTLIAQHFPNHVGSVVGLSQTSMSIGFVVGPTIGSGLYELGGFSLPFLALGLLILGSAIVSILLIIFEKKERAKKDQIIGEKGEKVEKEGEEENRKEMDKLLEKKVNLMRMFCIPEIALTLVSLFALEFSLFFYDASLTEHLMPLSPDRAPLLAGLLLSLTALFCMVSAPIWGFLIDRFGCYQTLMISGTLMGLCFPLLLGPSPFLPFGLSIPSLLISFGIQGLAITTLNTPSFKFCLEGAKNRGFGETDTRVTGCISGLLNGAVALGAFIGVTAGGASVQWIGFEQSSTVAGLIHFVPLIAQVFLCFRRK